MHLLPSVLVVLGAATVKADLSCLEWAPISPIIGLVCHFKPKVYNAAAEAAEKGTEEAIQSVENLVKFDLTHNPAALIYDYASTTKADGTAAANQELGASLSDFSGVTIGFTKESINQVVTIYDLLDWTDVTRCLITRAPMLPKIPQIAQRRQVTSSAPVPLASDLVGGMESVINQVELRKLVAGCVEKKLSKPLTFNITGSESPPPHEPARNPGADSLTNF
jgi:hypothetical protein